MKTFFFFFDVARNDSSLTVCLRFGSESEILSFFFNTKLFNTPLKEMKKERKKTTKENKNKRKGN